MLPPAVITYVHDEMQLSTFCPTVQQPNRRTVQMTIDIQHHQFVM